MAAVPIGYRAGPLALPAPFPTRLMSYPVKVSFQVDGGVLLNDFLRLQLDQQTQTHHAFALDLSVEALAKALKLAPSAVPTQAPERLIGKPVAISWTSVLPADQGRSFGFKGIITHLSLQTNADLVNYYHLSGFSPTYLLEDGVQHRTFVKQPLQQIMQQVTGEYDANVLPTSLKALNQDELAYIVQYGESNFYFLSRLAAQYGEWLYYDGQTLRLGREDGKDLAFKSNGSQQFALALHLQPGHTQGGHYNYRTHQTLATTAATPGTDYAYARLAVQKSDELFTKTSRLPAGTYARDESQLQKRLDGLAAQRAASQVTLTGSGEVFDTAPGCVLSVQDAAGESYGKFWVLAVRHEIDEAGNYRNTFQALPTATATPPANLLYPPPAAQPELAEVIDLQDPRRLGRVRVRFQWPVASPADAETGWLRVSTPYSGNGKGQLFVPEVGSQVLVGYQQGQAEFPVVLGNLFHDQNPQQAFYTRPENNLKGMQTAGGNKFVMQELAGAQSILLSNSNKEGTSILVNFSEEGSVSITTNGPVNITSGDTISIQAKQNISLRAGGDITLAADKNILAETKDESIGLRAKQELVLTAVDDELTLEATTKKLVAKSADNVEISATAVAKIMGADIKWSKS